MHSSTLAAVAALFSLTVAQASSTITLVAPPNASPGMAGSTEFTISGNAAVFATGTADGVNALAFDLAGNLYEADSGGKIYKVTPQGVASQFTSYAATGINNPTGLAVDVDGSLYVSGSGNSTGLVVKVAANGASSTSLYDSSNPANGVALDLAGNLYVSSFGAIYKIAPGGSTSTFATGTTGYGLATTADGFLYEGRQFDNSIKKYALDGSSAAIFATGLTQPGDVAVDASSNVYYFDFTSRASYLVGAGNANVTSITYPDVATNPTYHLAIKPAPEPSRTLCCLLAVAAVGLRRRRGR